MDMPTASTAMEIGDIGITSQAQKPDDVVAPRPKGGVTTVLPDLSAFRATQ
jgi:hypothetical protein